MSVDTATALTVFELLTFPRDETEGTASVQVFKQLQPGARGLLRFYLMDFIQHLLLPEILEGIPGQRAWIAQPNHLGALVAHGLVQAKTITVEQKSYMPADTTSDSWFTLTDVGRRVARLTTTGQFMPPYLIQLGLREMTIADLRDTGDITAVAATPQRRA